MAQDSIGPYRIVRQLGQGGMGAVLEAQHRVLQRRVAIKLLKAEFAGNRDMSSRLLFEGVAVSVVDHPGLVQIHDCGLTEDGSPYLVMEYLSGQTLGQRLKRCGGRLSESEAIEIAAQLASALTAAHARGVIHRDLKPGNVMLVPDPAMPSGERVKLLDFGIAKLAKGIGEGRSHSTKHNMVLGTPSYMSPEQCLSASDLDGRSDVYSLGLVLYLMLAGRLPFVGDGYEELAKRISEPAPPILQFVPGISPQVAALIERMLATSRDARPMMSEVADALAQARRKAGGSEAPSALPATTLLPQVSLRPAPVQPAVQADDAPETEVDTEDTTNPLRGKARRKRLAPKAVAPAMASSALPKTVQIPIAATVAISPVKADAGALLSRTSAAGDKSAGTASPLRASALTSEGVTQSKVWRRLRQVLWLSLAIIVGLGWMVYHRGQGRRAANPAPRSSGGGASTISSTARTDPRGMSPASTKTEEKPQQVESVPPTQATAPLLPAVAAPMPQTGAAPPSAMVKPSAVLPAPAPHVGESPTHERREFSPQLARPAEPVAAPSADSTQHPSTGRDSAPATLRPVQQAEPPQDSGAEPPGPSGLPTGLRDPFKQSMRRPSPIAP